MSRRALAIALSCALVASANAAAANPLDTFGFGSRASAMGSAVAADATDFSAVYYNPAALVGAKGLDLSIGYLYASHHLSINGHDSRVDPVRGLVGGFVAPGEVLGLPFAFGIATHVPDDRLSRVRTLRQETPRWELYDNRSQLLYLASDLAIRPVRWLEVGGGITYLAATRGRLDITGTADIARPTDSQLRHEVDADLTPVRYPQAGIRVLPSDDVAFALVYRGQSKLRLALDAYLHGQVKAAGILVPAAYSLETRTIDAFIPQQLVLGSSVKLARRRLHIDFDVTWVNWAAYESATARSTAHFDVQVPAGIPLAIPPDPKPTQILPPEFQNRLVPHVGVEYLVAVGDSVELPVRAGYVYEKSPVPPQTGITNFVDADRHVLSAGTGVRLAHPSAELPGDVRIDLHVQYSLLPERVVLKTNPADFVGDYRASGNLLAGGATLSLGF